MQPPPSDEHPFEKRQPLQEYFRKTLHTVMGQALDAAGYTLRDEPQSWIGGRFRYVKALDDNLSAYIAFQVLVYNDNAWIAGQPSRFQVMLVRSDKAGGKPSTHPQYAKRNLAALVVDDFGVDILPSASHWWQFHNQQSLGDALAEAGHLVIGYGVPWLAGELHPDDERGASDG